MRKLVALLAVLAAFSACGDDDSAVNDGAPDGGGDGGPSDGPVSTANCDYQALPPTGGAGGTVTAGDLSAGAAERPIGMAIGSAMGGYTARANFIGNSGRVDIRDTELSGAFNPSIGIETIPKVKALALSAGGETIVFLKCDVIFPDDTIVHDVADMLGPSFAGKVVMTGSHSHSAPGQFSANTAIGGVGSGILRERNREQFVGALFGASQDALANLRPARMGIALDPDFDPMNDVAHDRRGENDMLAGGSLKDKYLFVIRVDGTDGIPIAVVPIFGMHGVILDADNPLFSTDAPGSVDRAVEEAFDDHVVVMHMQGAGGDVSPSGHGGVNTIDGDAALYNFSRAESVGRYARPMVMNVWNEAGAVMQDQVAIEMVTRSVELGPDWKPFAIRGGALAYAPFVQDRPCDRDIYDQTGAILSPIDEFNAPHGAALCGTLESDAIFPAAQLPNTQDLGPYRSCIDIKAGGSILGEILGLPLEPDGVVCGATRTTVSAIRLGDKLIATLPGEPVTLLAEAVRAKSPLSAQDTIVLGYAQGEMGYVLTPEDWLLGGYEPSINFWGPLEGEYLAEQVAALFPLAMSPEREDATTGGTTRLSTPHPTDDDVPPPDPAPLAGTVPGTVPDTVYMRGYFHPTQGEPAASLWRVSGIARFVWIGEDPLAGTPQVTLQRETSPGVFTDVTRRSGRKVVDGDFLVMWTPDPLRRMDGVARTHYWTVEWQAVTPSGTPGMDDDLQDRAGLPLGKYRFHVQGPAYTVDSSAFDVIPGPLNVTASPSGASVNLQVRYDAPDGFRLLDYFGDSDRPVPVRTGPVDVHIDYAGGGSDDLTGQAINSDGTLTVAAPGGTPSMVIVTDRFGNTGSAPVL